MLLFLPFLAQIVQSLITCQQLYEKTCDESGGHWAESGKKCVRNVRPGKTWFEGMGRCQEAAPKGWLGKLLHIDSQDVADLLLTITSASGSFWTAGKRMRSNGTSLNDFDWISPGDGTVSVASTVPGSVGFVYSSKNATEICLNVLRQTKLATNNCLQPMVPLCEFTEDCDCSLLTCNKTLHPGCLENYRGTKQFEKKAANVSSPTIFASFHVEAGGELLCGKLCRERGCCRGFLLSDTTCHLITANQGNDTVVEQVASSEFWHVID